MQTMFRLPWSTDHIASKVQTSKAALGSMRTSPVMDMAALIRRKRKRADSPEPYEHVWVPPAKRQQTDDAIAETRLPATAERELLPEGTLLPVDRTVYPQHTSRMAMALDGAGQGPSQQAPISPSRPGVVDQAAQVPKSAPNASLRDTTDDPPMEEKIMDGAIADLSPLQQVIENEFNMQILLKHNELRLIEQELAKCQVALEQLRRCELRPYPGTDRPSLQVSTGTGSSILPPHDHHRPPYAPPHGVTDGPYTRHYRHWLLHDPQFDPVTAVPQPDNASHADVRATRHASTARKPVLKVLATSATGVDTPRIPPPYPSNARKFKLALVKRSTDNQMVKLVCNHCHRSDFSNSQGFLNHCRIAHKVDYKSHDLAAIDCGQPLDEEERANVPPETLNAPTSKPTTSRSSSTANTPFKAHAFAHPMNSMNSAMTSHNSLTASAHRAPAPRPLPISVPSRSDSRAFPASSLAPRLSAQFAKHGLGGNLEEAIASAKQKIDFSADDDLSPSVAGSASPLTPAAKGLRSVFGASREGSLPPHSGAVQPSSNKGYRHPASRPRPSPLMQTAAKSENSWAAPKGAEHSEIPESPHDRSMDLSPHTTADSNPGLVSDDEDDDHGSASEDEVPQTAMAHAFEMVGRRECSDGVEIDVSVDDDDLDEHGVVIHRNSMLGTEHARLKTAGSPSRPLNGRK